MKDNFESALNYAIDKHKGQLDKGWTPYIQHLLGVWSRVRFHDLTTQICALLHDVIEDTDGTYEEIALNFGSKVADTIQLLTHDRKVRYPAYILNIIESRNQTAINVKIADLEDNSSEIRLQRLPEGKQKYFQKRITTTYLPAKQQLQAALLQIRNEVT